MASWSPPASLNHRRAANDARYLRRDLQHPTPHRAHNRRATPESAYLALPKAAPTQATPHFRIRHDTVDQFGKLTLRHGSRLHHLGIGRRHAATPVLILVATQTVTVISKTGHHLIASHTIDPDRNYWRNQQKTPADGRGDL